MLRAVFAPVHACSAADRLQFAMVCLLAVSGAACGGGGGLKEGLYSDAEARYEVGKLDAGWQPLALDGGNDLAWMNKELDAIVQVNSRCDPGLDIPLVSLTQHLLIGFTERDITSQHLVPLDGRESLRTHLRAKLDGVDRTLVFYVLKKDGCVYDFALITGQKSPDSSSIAIFDAFVRAFHVRRTAD